MSLVSNIIVIGIIPDENICECCQRCHLAPCQNILKRNNIIYIFVIGVKLYKRLGGVVPDATLPLARMFLNK